MIIRKVRFYIVYNTYFMNGTIILIFVPEGTVPAKRTRRSMAPSPSPAEGQASKPESSAVMSDVSIILHDL